MTAVSLLPGVRVGPYDVVALLGAGGMGEVFRARDARLQRDVALKVLPAGAVGNAEQRDRFEREAKVLASLSHPAIAHIFGIEVHAGAPVIVMELIEGMTLAERIARGPLPLDEAVAIALQICDGLEAAHDRGIIHRDLKPANIKLMPSGAVKILDFGLARVMTPEAAAPNVADSPTMFVSGTDVGVVLGTAAYMSPEQARGQTVDHRADIWALGCIVFEMLTGRPTYGGQSAADIVAEVIRSEPEWAVLSPVAPQRLVSVLKRCLQKQAKDRWRDIGDVRIAIEEAARDAGTAGDRLAAPTTPAPRAARGAWLALLAGLVIGGAGVFGALQFTPAAAPADAPAPVRTSVTLPAGTTISLTRGAALALSPDGRQLVFVGQSEGKTALYLRPIDRFDVRPIPGTEDAVNPFFSPDGRSVGFFAGNRLKRVALDGGAPVTVGEIQTPRGQVWAEADTIFLTASNNVGITRLSVLDGTQRPVTELQPGELSHRWPSVLPDRSAMFFSIWNDVGWEPARIAVQPINGGERKILVQAGGGHPRYVRDQGRRGFLVYARSEGLLASPFDEASLSITGQPIPVVDNVITNLSGGAHFALSSAGTIAYIPGAPADVARELEWVTLDGKPVSRTRLEGVSRVWRASPDGTRILHNSATGTSELFIRDIARQTTAKFTESGEYTTSGVWSPDGRWIVFARGAPVSNLYRQSLETRSRPERLTTMPGDQFPTSVSPDGRAVLFAQLDVAAGSDIMVLTLPAAGASGAAVRPFVKTNASEGSATFSPDGRWVAYQSNDSGRFEVYVRSFPDGDQMTRVSVDGGLSPQWAPDGRRLFFLGASERRMMVAPIVTGTGVTAGEPRALFDARSYENVFQVTPDGQRIGLMPLISAEQSASQINLVFDFLADLRQRVR